MNRIAFSVALGGFLMGFDASVISGVLSYVEARFALSSLELGWLVACLALTSSFAMLGAGVVSNRYGRRATLRGAAALYLISALASAWAPSYEALVIARMVGGVGVGAALIVAPLYIAELAPAEHRGRLVSLNQLNIVLGISAAFFSNYLLVLGLPEGGGDLALLGWTLAPWRVMLGVEALPALIYLLVLAFVPESPRWLFGRGDRDQALAILSATAGEEEAARALTTAVPAPAPGTFRDLLDSRLRAVLLAALIVAVLQQITGINAVFFYAPMIFEKAGAGTSAALLQAVLLGIVNLLFTLVALRTIDRFGRRPLLLGGTLGIAVAMTLLAWAFSQATYGLSSASLAALPDPALGTTLAPLADLSFSREGAFRAALGELLAPELLQAVESDLVRTATALNAELVLFAIVLFVASFAASLGPVMWVLFSELFPQSVRALAAASAGLVNSLVSFLVQLLFPWGLAAGGPVVTFGAFAGFAALGFVLVSRYVPETRGRALEALERELVSASKPA